MGVLGIGSSGANVLQLQQQLRKAGYNIAADGQFGPQTQAALRQFQQKAGIGVDGLYGSQSAAALQKALAPHPAPAAPTYHPPSPAPTSAPTPVKPSTPIYNPTSTSTQSTGLPGPVNGPYQPLSTSGSSSTSSLQSAFNTATQNPSTTTSGGPQTTGQTVPGYAGTYASTDPHNGRQVFIDNVQGGYYGNVYDNGKLIASYFHSNPGSNPSQKVGSLSGFGPNGQTTYKVDSGDGKGFYQNVYDKNGKLIASYYHQNPAPQQQQPTLQDILDGLSSGFNSMFSVDTNALQQQAAQEAAQEVAQNNAQLALDKQNIQNQLNNASEALDNQSFQNWLSARNDLSSRGLAGSQGFMDDAATRVQLSKNQDMSKIYQQANQQNDQLDLNNQYKNNPATIQQQIYNQLLTQAEKSAQDRASSYMNYLKAVLPYELPTAYQQGQLGLSSQKQLMDELGSLGLGMNPLTGQLMPTLSAQQDANTSTLDWAKLMGYDQNGNPTLDAKKLDAQVIQWATTNSINQAKVQLQSDQLNEKIYYDTQMINKASIETSDTQTKDRLSAISAQMSSIGTQLDSLRSHNVSPNDPNYQKLSDAYVSLQAQAQSLITGFPTGLGTQGGTPTPYQIPGNMQGLIPLYPAQ